MPQADGTHGSCGLAFGADAETFMSAGTLFSSLPDSADTALHLNEETCEGSTKGKGKKRKIGTSTKNTPLQDKYALLCVPCDNSAYERGIAHVCIKSFSIKVSGDFFMDRSGQPHSIKVVHAKSELAKFDVSLKLPESKFKAVLVNCLAVVLRPLLRKYIQQAIDGNLCKTFDLRNKN